MSSVRLSGNASGTGIFTVASPNSNTDYTLTLPAATTTIVGTDATQTLTNKTIQGGAITSGTAVASTSGTSIDFTGIPSWVKRVTVLFNGVSLSGTSNFLIQIGSGSVTTSGYSASSLLGNNANGTTVLTATNGFPIRNAQASNGINSAAMYINLLGSNIYVNNHSYGDPVNVVAGAGGGTVTLSGALDRVRITTVNGTDTFDAGSINILYE